MKIPIFNSLNYPQYKKYKDKVIDIKKLNNLELKMLIKDIPVLKF